MRSVVCVVLLCTMAKTKATAAASIRTAAALRNTEMMGEPAESAAAARQRPCSTMMSINAAERKVRGVATTSSTTSSSSAVEEAAVAAAHASPVSGVVVVNHTNISSNAILRMNQSTSCLSRRTTISLESQIVTKFSTIEEEEEVMMSADGAAAAAPLQQQHQHAQHCCYKTASIPCNKRRMRTSLLSLSSTTCSSSSTTVADNEAASIQQQQQHHHHEHAQEECGYCLECCCCCTTTTTTTADACSSPTSSRRNVSSLISQFANQGRKRTRPKERGQDRQSSSAAAAADVPWTRGSNNNNNNNTGGVLARRLGGIVLFLVWLLQSSSNSSSRLFVLGERPRLRHSSRLSAGAGASMMDKRPPPPPAVANVFQFTTLLSTTAVAASSSSTDRRRGLANTDPPVEQNVSSAPTLVPTLSPSTPPPTLVPTSTPTTLVPTSTPTTLVPTLSPTATPTLAPSSLPSVVDIRNELPPSAQPSIDKNPPIAARFDDDDTETIISNGTVFPNNAAQSAQEAPTMAPSSPSSSLSSPTLLTSSAAPTMTIWVRFRVENSMQVELQIPSNRAVNVEAVATAWRFFLLQQLQNAFDDTEIRIVDVFIFSTLNRLVNNNGQGGTRRRILQDKEDESNEQQQQEEELYPFLPTFLDTKVIVDLARNPNAKRDGAENNTNSNTTLDDYNKVADTLIESFLRDDVLENALNDPNVRVSNVKFTNGNAALDDNGDSSNDKDVNRNSAGVNSLDSDGNGGKTKPSPVQVVLGFLILGIAVGSLFFWAHVLWKKRQKRLTERRRQQVRKANTYVIGPSTSAGGASTSSAYGQAAAAARRQEQVRPSSSAGGGGGSVVSMASGKQGESRRFRKSQVVGVAPTTTTTGSSNQRRRGNNNNADDDDAASAESSGTSSYKGVGTSDDDDDDDDTDVGSDAVSDPFARELQQAASLDEAAWNEFQRKKQDLQRQGRLAASIYATSRINDSRDGFAALDEEEGVEVQNVAAFPYGRESTTMRTSRTSLYNSNLVELSPISSTRSNNNNDNGGVSWTATTADIAARLEETLNNGDGGFEPYGDNNGSNKNKENSMHRQIMEQSMEEKWDLEKNPIEDDPAQFSFLNPLQRRSIDETTVSSDDPTNVAIKVSPTTSASWSEAGGTSMVRTSPMSEDHMTPLGLEVEENSKEDSFNALDMVKEVERLSAYVKRYEERKEKRQHGDFIGPTDAITSNHTSPTVGSSSAGVVPYDAMSDSTSTKRALGAAAGEPQSYRLKRVDAPGHRLDHSPRDINEHDNSMSSRSRRADSRHAAQLLARLHNFGHDAVGGADTTHASAASGLLFGHGLEESSELTGSDSETEDSMRLGIDRFSIEKPEPLLMSFRSSIGIEESDSGESPERRLINLSQDDVPLLSANSAYRSDTSRVVHGHHNQDKGTTSNGHARSTSPRSSSPRGSLDAKVKRSTLSMSRVNNRNRPHDEHSHHSHSMAPSDERDYLRDEKKDSNVNDRPPPPLPIPPPPLSSSPIASPRQTSRQSAAVAAAVRSKNQGFNSIISMFESKPKNPITPPSDSWQHSGLKTGILTGSPTRLGRRPMTPTKQISRNNTNAGAEVDI